MELQHVGYILPVAQVNIHTYKLLVAAWRIKNVQDMNSIGVT